MQGNGVINQDMDINFSPDLIIKAARPSDAFLDRLLTATPPVLPGYYTTSHLVDHRAFLRKIKPAYYAVESQELDVFGITQELRVFVQSITLNPSTDFPLVGNGVQNSAWRSMVFRSCYGTFLALKDDGKTLINVSEGSDGSIPQNAVWKIGNQELEDKGLLRGYSTQAKEYESCTLSFDLPAIQLSSNFKNKASDVKWWFITTRVGDDKQSKLVRSDDLRDYRHSEKSDQLFLAALSDGTVKMRAKAECWEHPDGNHNWIILFTKADSKTSIKLRNYMTSDDEDEESETYEIKHKVPVQRLPSKPGLKDVHVHNKYVMILNSNIGTSGPAGEDGASSSMIYNDINKNINESGTQTIGDVNVKSTVFGFNEVSFHFHHP